LDEFKNKLHEEPERPAGKMKRGPRKNLSAGSMGKSGGEKKII